MSRFRSTVIVSIVVFLASEAGSLVAGEAVCEVKGEACYEGSAPNVLVILTDDQGWGDLSLHGNRNLRTPQLDSIAQKGAQFRHFYVCPVCSPTRAEFLTGRWHIRGGVRDVTSGGERLDLDEVTIAQLFRQAGYRTAMFGKWHNGTQGAYHPTQRGFEEFYGFTSGHWGHYFSPLLEINDELTRGSGFLPDDLTNRALRFISSEDDRPFFLMMTYNTPHSPMQVPDAWWKAAETREITDRATLVDKEDLVFTRAALAMVENLDWNVGRLLQNLEQTGRIENTIIVFFCDNGPNSDRWNGGMKGKKGTVDEGGVRSPLFVRWDRGIAPDTVISPIASAIDLLPTLTSLAGVSNEGTQPLDGQDLSPLLKKQSNSWPDRLLFAHWNRRVSVRNQRFRLDEGGRLYDLENDPGQLRDVSAEYPDALSDLSAAAAAFRAQIDQELGEKPTGANRPRDPRPILLPKSTEHDNTLIPARDVRFSGTLQRSSRHPNCSYLLNWTSQGAIEFEIENPESGLFEAQILYSASSAEVGARVELAITDHVESSDQPAVSAHSAVSARAMITEPFESPEIGPEADRTERTESIVKDFGILNLGNIALPEGHHTLQLRTDRSGPASGLEFRMLTLRRIPR